MPNKYPERKGWKLPKQVYKVSNWAEYNTALRNRGAIDLWISDDAIERWYESDQVYDGTGAPKRFSDFAILTCHEIRQVYHLPLRQCQGFIDSLFRQLKLPLICPDYSSLSKRLSALSISVSRYRQTEKVNNDVSVIMIDSTGLKCFGQDEWHQEKYGLSGKKRWKKLHIVVDDKQFIGAALLTESIVSDSQVVSELIEPLDDTVGQVIADGAYDNRLIYEQLTDKFGEIDIIIPPRSSAVYHQDNHFQRNNSLQQIKTFGRIAWQRVRGYGQRNKVELAIQRYKKILGNTLRARENSRQKNEAIIGCGILNKMTATGMPRSCRVA